MHELDIVLFLCTIQYSGSWVPRMTWQRIGRKDSILSTQVIDVDEDGQSKTMRSILTIEALSTTNGDIFTCLIKFEAVAVPQIIHKPVATNVPDYEFQWITPALNVSCTYVTRNLS